MDDDNGVLFAVLFLCFISLSASLYENKEKEKHYDNKQKQCTIERVNQ